MEEVLGLIDLTNEHQLQQVTYTKKSIHLTKRFSGDLIIKNYKMLESQIKIIHKIQTKI